MVKGLWSFALRESEESKKKKSGNDFACVRKLVDLGKVKNKWENFDVCLRVCRQKKHCQVGLNLQESLKKMGDEMTGRVFAVENERFEKRGNSSVE